MPLHLHIHLVCLNEFLNMTTSDVCVHCWVKYGAHVIIPVGPRAVLFHYVPLRFI